MEYWFGSLNDVQRTNGTTCREGYTIIWAMLLLQSYLEGIQCTVRTDQKSLKWVLKLADVTGMLVQSGLGYWSSTSALYSTRRRNQEEGRCCTIAAGQDKKGLDITEIDDNLSVTVIKDISEDKYEDLRKEERAQWCICHIYDHESLAYVNNVRTAWDKQQSRPINASRTKRGQVCKGPNRRRLLQTGR